MEALKKYWWPWTGFLIALLMNLWRIGAPDTLAGDEVFFVRDGYDYVLGREYFDPHPPLGKLQLGAIFSMFGYGPVTWRLGNAVAGALIVPLLWWLARRLTNNRAAAGLTVILALLDGFRLVDSRLGLINIPYMVYGLAAVASVFKALDSPRPRWWLLTAGIFIGLSVSVKWLAGTMVIPAVALWYWSRLFGQRRNPEQTRSPGWLTAGSLFVLPAIIYWLAFAWHFAWLGASHEFWATNLKIMNYHLSVPAVGDAYGQPWWGWLAMWQPFLYWVHKTGQTVSVVWSLPNPWLWWTGATVFLGSLIVGWRRPATRFLNIMLLVAWLPFALIQRIMYSYHALVFDQWLIILVAAVIGRWWPRRRALLISYLAIAAITFIWFWPWYFNLPLSASQQQWRRWLPNWQVTATMPAISATPRPAPQTD